jgi:hypothetical protein
MLNLLSAGSPTSPGLVAEDYRTVSDQEELILG